MVRACTEVIEAFFAFETASGPAEGVLRLVADGDDPGRTRAWTLLTALAALPGSPEAGGGQRGRAATPYARDFGGENWLDKREQALAYADHDPAVIVVGGGQAGLSSPARLGNSGSTRSSSTAPRAGSATTGASATTR